jgi:hypothetical protein
MRETTVFCRRACKIVGLFSVPDLTVAMNKVNQTSHRSGRTEQRYHEFS